MRLFIFPGTLIEAVDQDSMRKGIGVEFPARTDAFEWGDYEGVHLNLECLLEDERVLFDGLRDGGTEGTIV